MDEVVWIVFDVVKMRLQTREFAARRNGHDTQAPPFALYLYRLTGREHAVEQLVNIGPQVRGFDVHFRKRTPATYA